MLHAADEDDSSEQVYPGQFHCLAMTDQGRVFGWGLLRHGRCGIGKFDPNSTRNAGLQVNIPAPWSAVFGGDAPVFYDHSCLLGETDTEIVWSGSTGTSGSQQLFLLAETDSGSRSPAHNVRQDLCHVRGLTCRRTNSFSRVLLSPARSMEWSVFLGPIFIPMATHSRTFRLIC